MIIITVVILTSFDQHMKQLYLNNEKYKLTDQFILQRNSA